LNIFTLIIIPRLHQTTYVGIVNTFNARLLLHQRWSLGVSLNHTWDNTC